MREDETGSMPPCNKEDIIVIHLFSEPVLFHAKINRNNMVSFQILILFKYKKISVLFEKKIMCFLLRNKIKTILRTY